jgi:hypothetical protein
MRRLLACLLLLASPLGAGLPRFSDESVNRFVAEADAAARRAAPLTPEFWSWVDRHPEVRSGLLFARHPMPAVHAANLDLLRRAVTPQQADRYAHLLLAVAVNGDQPLRVEAEQPIAAWPEPVAKVAAWMRASGTTYLQAMADTSAALAAAGVPAAEAARDRGFWTKVAHASGTYPPRLAASVPAHIRWLVDRLDAPAPEGGKQAWPAFPMAKAPWPLLTWFRDVPPERERDWIWDYYWGRLPGQSKSGIIGYGRYSWDYDRVPAVKHKASAWHPSSLPRIWEDGGVCGRLSTMGDTFRRTLGIPARGAGQPGHRAFVNYGWDAKRGQWTFGVGQSIAGIEVTTTSPDLAQPAEFLRNGAVNCQALVGAMNLGLDRWTRARILAWHAQELPAAPRARALRDALALNPYDLGSWRQLAEAAPDAPALARLLAEMDTLLVNPNSRIEEAERLSAATDFATLGGGDPKARSDVGNSVARVAGDALLRQGVDRLLAAGASRTELRSVVRAEVERRAGLKLPHGAAVSAQLLTRLDLLADGAVPVLASVESDARAADALKGKARERALADLALRLAALREADASQVEAWCSRVIASLAGASRWSLDKDGKPVPDKLLADLHGLRAHALRKLGPPAKGRMALAQAQFESGRPEPAAAPASPSR